MKKAASSFLLGFSLIACHPNQLPKQKVSPEAFHEKVIYGDDSRFDLWELPQNGWADVAQSTVAIFDFGKLEDMGQYYQIKATTYGKTYGLCTDEAFYDQPTSAFCSGSLIAPDIILTAGHCIRNDLNCQKARFVFGYDYKSEDKDPLIIASDEVYSCAEVIHTETNALTGSDFALVRLDREVVGHEPLNLRKDKNLIADNQDLAVIGHPSGIPSKFAAHASVRNNDPEKPFFVTNLDTFGGNSGSAVFNLDTQEIEGILVRGESDFAFDNINKCRRAKVCQLQDCRGEDVVRISVVLDFLSTPTP
ncbi:MAG: trypsin-like peptidase domain-containing protein [Bdellovibrionales bacterium]|nr:trypsin-like peptidase domain-containing protein [Bdellovibrionales bacterium]